MGSEDGEDSEDGDDDDVLDEHLEDLGPAAAAAAAFSFTSALKPTEVVKALDDYIVGQADAKRAVAIALRNRWRRKQLPEEFKTEVRRSFPLSSFVLLLPKLFFLQWTLTLFLPPK